MYWGLSYEQCPSEGSKIPFRKLCTNSFFLILWKYLPWRVDAAHTYIPNCERVKINIKEYQLAEQLFSVWNIKKGTGSFHSYKVRSGLHNQQHNTVFVTTMCVCVCVCVCVHCIWLTIRRGLWLTCTKVSISWVKNLQRNCVLYLILCNCPIFCIWR